MVTTFKINIDMLFLQLYLDNKEWSNVVELMLLVRLAFVICTGR